jgi:hypothetical protein
MFDDLFLEFWVLLLDDTEHVSAEAGKGVVVSRLDRSRAQRVINKTDFSEMVTFAENPHCNLLFPIMFPNVDQAITSCYEVHGIRRLILLEDKFFGEDEMGFKERNQRLEELATAIHFLNRLVDLFLFLALEINLSSLIAQRSSKISESLDIEVTGFLHLNVHHYLGTAKDFDDNTVFLHHLPVDGVIDLQL